MALPDSGITRGIAADDRGRIFVASSHAWIHIDPRSIFGFVEASDPITRLSVFNADGSGGVRIFGTSSDPLPGQGAIGVGLDSDHRAWLINQDTGSATRVDVDSGEIKHFGVGDLPYTYSDFTGFALRRITAPERLHPRRAQRLATRPHANGNSSTSTPTSRPARASRSALRTGEQPNRAARAHWLGPWDSANGSIDSAPRPRPLPETRLLEVEARLVSQTATRPPCARSPSASSARTSEQPAPQPTTPRGSGTWACGPWRAPSSFACPPRRACDDGASS